MKLKDLPNRLATQFKRMKVHELSCIVIYSDGSGHFEDENNDYIKNYSFDDIEQLERILDGILEE